MSNLPYSQRPEWKDVVPVAQDDGPNPLVPIAYSSDCKKSYFYFYVLGCLKMTFLYKLY